MTKVCWLSLSKMNCDENLNAKPPDGGIEPPPTHLPDEVINTVNRIITPKDRLNVYNIMSRDLLNKESKKK